MTRKASIVILALLTYFAAGFSHAGEKPDFRDVTWGMSKEEVKKRENTEMVKEGEFLLIYKIKGETVHEVIEQPSALQVEGQKPVIIEYDIELPDYDLVYLFPDNKLGMAILHMNNPQADADDYLDEFDRKADELVEKTGKEPKGMAKYGENETEDVIYKHPERICSGIYAIKLSWPTVDDKTNIMMELDDRKTAPDKSECTLSIFYESVKYPLDPASSDKMHREL